MTCLVLSCCHLHQRAKPTRTISYVVVRICHLPSLHSWSDIDPAQVWQTSTHRVPLTKNTESSSGSEVVLNMCLAYSHCHGVARAESWDLNFMFWSYVAKDAYQYKLFVLLFLDYKSPSSVLVLVIVSIGRRSMYPRGGSYQS